jgi:hypothetical protein
MSQIHFVHYKSSYGDPLSAMQHGDGLAVVAVFLQVLKSFFFQTSSIKLSF